MEFPQATTTPFVGTPGKPPRRPKVVSPSITMAPTSQETAPRSPPVFKKKVEEIDSDDESSSTESEVVRPSLLAKAVSLSDRKLIQIKNRDATARRNSLGSSAQSSSMHSSSMQRSSSTEQQSQASWRPSSPTRRRRSYHGIRHKARNPEKMFVYEEGSVTNWDTPEAGINNLAIELANPDRIPDREYVSIHDDVYNLFFLSSIGRDAFWYSVYVFGLKMALYTFLAMDAFKHADLDNKTSITVLAAQFLMLPVAVAMQDDLVATYYLIANIKYCPSIRKNNPDASEWKFNVGTACRAIDGAYSLCVNFVVLMSATQVMGLFLNFAALQFLQTIDNIALELAADGYLTSRLEEVALQVKLAELPKRSEGNWLRLLDTVLFVATVLILIGFWCTYVFYVQTDSN